MTRFLLFKFPSFPSSFFHYFRPEDFLHRSVDKPFTILVWKLKRRSHALHVSTYFPFCNSYIRIPPFYDFILSMKRRVGFLFLLAPHMIKKLLLLNGKTYCFSTKRPYKKRKASTLVPLLFYVWVKSERERDGQKWLVERRVSHDNYKHLHIILTFPNV